MPPIDTSARPFPAVQSASGRSAVAFLAGDGADGVGRRLDDVLDGGNDELENRHDYIQWLFPLAEPSGAVPGSPVLSGDDIAAIHASPRARANLLAAAERMKRFYSETGRWKAGPDHNHLRITRIIRSLRLLVGDGAADAFRHHVLTQTAGEPDRISAETRRFWSEA